MTPFDCVISCSIVFVIVDFGLFDYISLAILKEFVWITYDLLDCLRFSIVSRIRRETCTMFVVVGKLEHDCFLFIYYFCCSNISFFFCYICEDVLLRWV